MEQLEEDVRGYVRQEDTATCQGNDSQEDCSASYAAHDGDNPDD